MASHEPAAPEHSPVASPANPQPATGPQQGAPDELPDLSFPDSHDEVRRLSSWRGHPLFVNFWATWCEPCRREIPLFESLLRGPSGRGLQVVGIAVDERDATLKYLRTMGIDYPVLIAGEDGGLKAMGAFGTVAGLPVTVFADAKGQIVGVKEGELHPDEAHLVLGRLLDLDAGRLTLAAARDQISSGLKSLAVRRATR
jgi:thiol-disulfide isomerase/thioredoxin